MKITLVHQYVPADAAADERDVLDQVSAIKAALAANGHAVSVLPCTTDLGNLQRKLEVLRPDCVFNLVETLDGSGRLIHLAPALWETKDQLFTGSSSEALYLTTHKLLSKERMLAAGLPVPAWELARDLRAQTACPKVTRHPTARDGLGDSEVAHDLRAGSSDWIIKSVWEHASVGLSDASIVRNVTAAEVADRIPAGSFAEQFIDGREFNLALLAGPDGPEVLPPAEIVFVDFPSDKPKIVGYQAKWDEASFEYAHTVRRFADAPADDALLAELKRLALRCWEAFALGGYARVDFRVDASGKPWILEVNSNPCLSPDSGFAAALAKAGIPYADAIERIVQAVARASRPCSQPPRAGRLCHTGLPPAVTFRYEVTPSDVEAIREVTASTDYFHNHEIPVAVELVEERLAKGASSGYEFVVAECEGRVIGYTSFGPIPCTQSSFDWYWLAVRPELQGFGFGKELLRQVEVRAKAMGGTRLYCETSGRPKYASTRAFYERLGFTLCEILDDYYEPGDGRATYVKPL
jgi:D-alanine-D-alanine ligase-like ATP-grasp enzyme/ribosomal protein S18 acetylase RimI-like enzyme